MEREEEGPQSRSDSTLSRCHLKVGEINGVNDPAMRFWQVHGFSEFDSPALLPKLSGKEGEHFRRSFWNVRGEEEAAYRENGLPYPPWCVCDRYGHFCGPERQVASENQTCPRTAEPILRIAREGQAAET